MLLHSPVPSLSSIGWFGGITSRCGLGSGGEVVPALSVGFIQQPSNTTHHLHHNAKMIRHDQITCGDACQHPQHTPRATHLCFGPVAAAQLARQ